MSSPLSTHSKHEFIEHTLLELQEGLASKEDISKLQALLMNDLEARQIYLRANQLASMLETRSTKAESLVPTVDRFRIQRSHLVSAFLGAGIAAALLLLASLKPFSHSDHQTRANADKPTPPSYASLLSNHEAIISGSPATPHQDFSKGQLALERGIAQLSFQNGAQIILEGHCGFEIIDEMSVILTHGKMWAYCPKDAHGFQVLTPGGRKIIDLGTEFGIEVDSSGATNVHVFDGLVDIISPASEPQRVNAGSAVNWASAATPINRFEAQPDKFVNAETLASKRLQVYRKSMASREDLLLYYNFDNQTGNKCNNSVSDSSKQAQGLIQGAATVHGRFNGSKALQFENSGDRVEFKMPSIDSLPGYTTAAWIKVDRFESYLSTIINSNNWELGSAHFQIDSEGAIKAGINGGLAFRSNSKAVSLGKWHFIAVSWNLETNKAQIFNNGIPIPSSSRQTPQLSPLKPQLGLCQIGAWTETLDYQDNKTLNPPRLSRGFRGRIDEIMIFDHALTGKEIDDLYTIGRP